MAWNWFLQLAIGIAVSSCLASRKYATNGGAIGSPFYRTKLSCVGKISDSGDAVAVETQLLSQTSLGPTKVKIFTELGIDDPAPYAIASADASNEKLLKKQAAGLIEAPLMKSSEALNFSRLNCFDLSKETGAAKEAHLCILKTSPNSVRRSIPAVVVTDVINGAGYVNYALTTCHTVH